MIYAKAISGKMETARGHLFLSCLGWGPAVKKAMLPQKQLLFACSIRWGKYPDRYSYQRLHNNDFCRIVCYLIFQGQVQIT